MGTAILALPFVLLGLYAFCGLPRGRALKLASFVQALTVLAGHEAAGSSSSTAAIVFIVPLVAGPATGAP